MNSIGVKIELQSWFSDVVLAILQVLNFLRPVRT